MSHKKGYNEEPVEPWFEFRELVKKKFGPPHYHKANTRKHNKPYQTTKGASDLYRGMNILISILQLDDDEEIKMARFFKELNLDLADKFYLRVYEDMDELLHFAIK